MAIMGSIGLAIIYGFKVNVSVAIVAMVNNTALGHKSENGTDASDVCGFTDVVATDAHTTEVIIFI